MLIIICKHLGIYTKTISRLRLGDYKGESPRLWRLIVNYFFCGYDYNEILLFLSKYHNCEMSYSTLLRRLKEYGLQRRKLMGPRFEDMHFRGFK